METVFMLKHWLTWSRHLHYRIPVIASGGVTTLKQVEQMIQAGAYAVQVDTVLWGKGLS